MPWIQLSLVVAADRVPLIEAALENAGALAVSLGDAVDGRRPGEALLEPLPGTTPLWDKVKVVGLFDEGPETSTSLAAICRSLTPLLEAEPAIERLPDRTWERVWLADFEPKRFGRRLWICPRGHRVGDADAVVVALDPGLAFGTGHHASTALCLRWLDAQSLARKTVLDYGCGSGILAIAALLLGADRAIAVDRDPQAIEATRANAERNSVLDRLVVCQPHDLPEQPADLILANILARTLIAIAPNLTTMAGGGAQIALSGILSDQADEVADAYRPWFDLAPPRTEDEWVLLTGRRRRNRRD